MISCKLVANFDVILEGMNQLPERNELAENGGNDEGDTRVIDGSADCSMNGKKGLGLEMQENAVP